VTGYAELLVGSEELDLLLNGLVSSISGIIASPGSTAVVQGGIKKLAILNAMCDVDDTFWSRVKEFRIIMLLKTVLDWPSAVEGSSHSWVVSTEVLRLLRSVIPWVKHVESDFWGKGLDLLKEALEVFPLVTGLTI
jgi:hypothetical protein